MEFGGWISPWAMYLDNIARRESWKIFRVVQVFMGAFQYNRLLLCCDSIINYWLSLAMYRPCTNLKIRPQGSVWNETHFLSHYQGRFPPFRANFLLSCAVHRLQHRQDVFYPAIRPFLRAGCLHGLNSKERWHPPCGRTFRGWPAGEPAALRGSPFWTVITALS